MPQYADPNMVLAAQIGQGLAGLFGPRAGNNEAKMKYLLGASQVGENKSQISRNDAATALDTQEHGFRGNLGNAATVARAINVPEDNPMAAIFANLLGISTGAQDGVDALNKGIGGMMVRSGDDTKVRPGAVSMGMTPGENDALTASELAKQFSQETSLNDADNATSRANAGTQAGATIQSARIRADADMFGSRLQYGPGGSSDRNGGGRGGAGKGQAGKPKGPAELTPSEAEKLRKELTRSLPKGTQIDRNDEANMVLYAGRYFRRTGDATAAIAHALRGLSVTPGVEEEKPWWGENTPAQPARARWKAPPVIGAPAASGNIDDLVNSILGGR
jgi:hypothetical protein